MSQEQYVNVIAAADESLALTRAALTFAVAAVRAQEKPHPTEELSSVVPLPQILPVTTAAATTSIDWPCVAIAETGGDVTMHGSTYSTMYGVVNDIVEDYASPEVQARVFSGTATEAEQTDIVARFAADHGTGGWGVLTKQKCGL